MTENKWASICYLATLWTIGTLCLAGAAVCIWTPSNTEVALSKQIGALTFIGAGITGLIGVIGTFRPKGPPTTSTTTESGDINLPADPNKPQKVVVEQPAGKPVPTTDTDLPQAPNEEGAPWNAMK